jgi:hypothetical protein
LLLPNIRNVNIHYVKLNHFYCHFELAVIIGVLADRFYFGLVIGVIKEPGNLLRDKCVGTLLKKFWHGITAGFRVFTYHHIRCCTVLEFHRPASLVLSSK